MLSLNLTSFNATIRTFPYWRLSSLLSTSVVNPETTNVTKHEERVIKKNDKYIKKDKPLQDKIPQTNVSETVKKYQNTTTPFVSLDERIINTNNTKDLISVMNDPNITINQVKQILDKISTLKVNEKQDKSLSETVKIEEKFPKHEINKGILFLPLATPKLIQILKNLTYTNDRNIPLLKTLTSNIATYSKKLNTKMCGDILYSLAVLNYADEILLEKTMSILLEELLYNDSGPVIGSIATSLKILKYKNCNVLDTIFTWANNNLEKLRFQDFTSIIGCLATFDYIPKNMDNLQDYMNSLTNKVTSNDQLWLDFVWSLTLLNRASHQHIASVLDNKFVEFISYKSNGKCIVNTLKLLNINGAARVIVKDYNGPYIKNKPDILSIVAGNKKQKLDLIDTLIETFQEIAPSSYQTNINTQMGFNIDLQCCLNSENRLVKCTNNSKNTRLAIMVNCYHDYSRGNEDLLGIAKFYNNLLTAQDYKVLNISYQNLSVNDVLAKHVKYVKDKINMLCQESSM